MVISGYRIVLPSPWVRLGLDDSAVSAIRDLVIRGTEDAEGRIPPDQLGPLRRQLEAKMLRQAEAAHGVGGRDLYFPAGNMHGLLVGASFVVSETYSPPLSGERAETIGVLTAMVEAGAAFVELDGTQFVRSEMVVAPGPEVPEVDTPTRRVTYFAARPDDPDRWVIVGFSCVGDGDPDSTATAVVVELFDAIMSTWTWTHDGGQSIGEGAPDVA